MYFPSFSPVGQCQAFTQAALSRFGSGWAWLGVSEGVLKVTSTANQERMGGITSSEWFIIPSP